MPFKGQTSKVDCPVRGSSQLREEWDSSLSIPIMSKSTTSSSFARRGMGNDVTNRLWGHGEPTDTGGTNKPIGTLAHLESENHCHSCHYATNSGISTLARLVTDMGTDHCAPMNRTQLLQSREVNKIMAI